MQQVNPNAPTRRSGRRPRPTVRATWSKLAAGLLCGLTAAASLQADVLLQGTQDPAFQSAFTLDFGAYGGTRTAEITSTNYTLSTDPIGRTAQFVSYHQDVQPLELPGGISTGNITVTIQQSLPGNYDPGTGVFSTNDIYLIYFTADLSMFGLYSPVALPGSANGTITYTSAAAGNIYSAWSGQGELQNPGDPGNPFYFSYDCTTHTNFVVMPEPATFAGLGLSTLVVLRRRR